MQRLMCGVEGYLEKEVERHPGQDGIREELNDAEESKHNPVGEPLRVVILVLGVNGLAPVHREVVTGRLPRTSRMQSTRMNAQHTHARTRRRRGTRSR